MTKNDRNRQLNLHKHLQAAPRGALQTVADAIGKKRQTVQKWASGERPLSQADYDRCCEALANFDRSLVSSIGTNYLKREHHLAHAPSSIPPSDGMPPTTNSLQDTLQKFLMDKIKPADEIKQKGLVITATSPPLLAVVRHRSRLKAMLTAVDIFEQQVKEISQKLSAGGAAAPDRHAILDYLHQA